LRREGSKREKGQSSKYKTQVCQRTIQIRTESINTSRLHSMNNLSRAMMSKCHRDFRKNKLPFIQMKIRKKVIKMEGEQIILTSIIKGAMIRKTICLKSFGRRSVKCPVIASRNPK
jgi:hypothetical protein